jgi:hypothetical protein
MTQGRDDAARREAALAGLLLAAERMPLPMAGGSLRAYAAVADTGRSWRKVRGDLQAAVEFRWLALVAPARAPLPAVYRVTEAGRAELEREAARLGAAAARLRAPHHSEGGAAHAA